MKRLYVGKIYFNKHDGTLAVYLGVEGSCRTFRDITGRVTGIKYYIAKENIEDYVPIKQIKLLELLYGVSSINSNSTKKL